MEKRIVILGSGMAGFSAASQIRSQDPNVRITMVSREQELPYLRPRLSKTCFCSFPKNRLAIVPESWYQNQRIKLLLGKRAVRILADEKRLLLENGETLDYDACIYALGASPILPPIIGADKKGVVTLHSLTDFIQLRNYAASARRAVVIGGGLTGLEIAWELSQSGCETRIFEAGPRLMESVLDRQSSQVFTELIQKKGVSVYTDVSVKEFYGQEENKELLGGIRLSDNRQFPADLAVVSCGLLPNLKLALDSGIACRQGVLVNEFLETNMAGIYAAGDCIQGRQPNPKSWNHAKISGQAAGFNALFPQKPQIFSPICEPAILNAMGTSLCSIGDVSEDGSKVSVVRQEKGSALNGLFLVNRHDGEDFSYSKKFYRNNRLCGAVLLGDLSQMNAIKQEIRKGGQP